MPYEGRCICGGIRVMLPQQPASSLRCYCQSCSRSGGGSSINYVLDDADVTVQDPNSFLKRFTDTNTDSGNHIERRFCGNCGSPVVTLSPAFAGKTILKASLFDTITPPAKEIFIHRRPEWQPPVGSAEQIGK